MPTYLEFVDIAGLVKGASKGEGLGNKFLGNIREVDAIVHVLRCFDTDTPADPVGDADVVATELMLADMESLQKRTDNLIKKSRGQDKAATAELALVERTLKLLEDGAPARKLDVDPEEAKTFRMLSLLTAKPVLYVLNVDEDNTATGNAASEKAAVMAEGEGAGSVIISAKIEEEVAQLSDPEERREFLESLDLSETGLDRVIRAGYTLLNLITFLTAGPKEVRAWTVEKGATAQEAAGAIHTDFQRGFIRVEVYSLSDLENFQSEKDIRAAGKMRVEGKDYVMQDGDICHFLFNV